MGKAAGADRRGRWGWTKEDEDIIACQVISAFSWVLLVLVINFFVLHRSNTVPSAEANLVEPQAAVRTPAPQRPSLQLARLPAVPLRPLERRDLLEDDYKPNYYFLYKDQIRFVDTQPKRRVMVASRKAIVPMPPPEKPEEVVKKELERVEPRPEPKPVAWLDMSLLEERPHEEKKPKREPPKETKRPPVTVVAAKDLEMDMEIVRDVPAEVPVVPRKERPKESLPKMRLSAVDVEMDLVEVEPEPEKPRRVAPAPATPKPVHLAAAGADFVAMPMEIEAASRPVLEGAAPRAGETPRKGVSRPGSLVKGPTAAVPDLALSMEIGERPAPVSRSVRHGTIKKKTGASGLVSVDGGNGKGIDLDLGMLASSKPSKGAGAARPRPAPAPKKPVRLTSRRVEGSIALGTPLAFALADVEGETHSGSAYVRKSSQLKRWLDQQHLPETPVTIPSPDGWGGVTAVSCSRDQVVLQYASGKQQVITLVEGEPYPRFELRLSGAGKGTVRVGTKLEEITSCITTLQHILKERGS